jgi:hypothetical protein
MNSTIRDKFIKLTNVTNYIRKSALEKLECKTEDEMFKNLSGLGFIESDNGFSIFTKDIKLTQETSIVIICSSMHNKGYEINFFENGWQRYRVDTNLERNRTSLSFHLNGEYNTITFKNDFTEISTFAHDLIYTNSIPYLFPFCDNPPKVCPMSDKLYPVIPQGNGFSTNLRKDKFNNILQKLSLKKVSNFKDMKLVTEQCNIDFELPYHQIVDTSLAYFQKFFEIDCTYLENTT